MREEEVEGFNQSAEERIYTVRRDIASPFGDQFEGSDNRSQEGAIFRKGEKVRILLEVSSEWLKVRAYRLDQSQEHSGGAVILFLITEVLEDQGEDLDNYSLERLRSDLAKILK